MTGSGGDGRLETAILVFLAGTDALSARLADARAIRERMGAGDPVPPLPDEAAFERSLRALAASGLVEATIEPYIPPRYLITRKGRERANPARCGDTKAGR